MSRPPHTVSLEEGIVVVRVPRDVEQDPEYARVSLQRAIDARGGVRRPLLVDVRGARPLTPETRHVYKGPEIVAAFTAFALLVDGNPVGRMMGNVYLRIARLGLPTQLFADESEARAWLRGFVS